VASPVEASGKPASGDDASGNVASGGGPESVGGGGPESVIGVPPSSNAEQNAGGRPGTQRLKKQQPPPVHPAQSALLEHVDGHTGGGGPESGMVDGHMGIATVEQRLNTQQTELPAPGSGQVLWHCESVVHELAHIRPVSGAPES
jgi:hypothetical protein